MTKLEQFKNFLNNKITNPFIPEEDRVEFTEVEKVYVEDIFVVAETDTGVYLYEPEPYQITEEGTSWFDFTFETKKATA